MSVAAERWASAALRDSHKISRKNDHEEDAIAASAASHCWVSFGTNHGFQTSNSINLLEAAQRRGISGAHEPTPAASPAWEVC